MTRPLVRRGPMTALQVVVVLDLIVFGFVGYLLAVTPLQQQRDQDVLFDRLRAELAEVTAPIGGAIEPGSPVAVLTIDAVGLDAVVVEGTASAQTLAGPGHRRDTPLPGQEGISLLYGRAGTAGAPFGDVPDLPAGTPIRVVTGQGAFEYRVERTRREGDPIAALPAGAGRLTLVTAETPRPLTASRPIYVDAALVGTPQPAPAGRPTSVTAAERALQTDKDALLPLVFWLQALAASVAGVTWSRWRWGARETWVVGTPVVLACVWQVYEAALRLLPNLL